MNESVLYIITYLLSQILGVNAAYKLITSFFQNRKMQKSLEIVAFIGYYFLTVMVYLLINIPIVNFAVNLFSFFILTLMYESSISLVFPNVQFYICPVTTQNIDKNNWYTSKNGIEKVMGEVERCGKYFGDTLLKGKLVEGDE